jgi:hypothetical protein
MPRTTQAPTGCLACFFVISFLAWVLNLVSCWAKPLQTTQLPPAKNSTRDYAKNYHGCCQVKPPELHESRRRPLAKVRALRATEVTAPRLQLALGHLALRANSAAATTSFGAASPRGRSCVWSWPRSRRRPWRSCGRNGRRSCRGRCRCRRNGRRRGYSRSDSWGRRWRRRGV